MKIEVPAHELSNYRIALKAWQESKTFPPKLWERVLGNAKRLAEAVDARERKASNDTVGLPESN